MDIEDIKNEVKKSKSRKLKNGYRVLLDGKTVLETSESNLFADVAVLGIREEICEVLVDRSWCHHNGYSIVKFGG